MSTIDILRKEGLNSEVQEIMEAQMFGIPMEDALQSTVEYIREHKADFNSSFINSLEKSIA